MVQITSQQCTQQHAIEWNSLSNPVLPPQGQNEFLKLDPNDIGGSMQIPSQLMSIGDSGSNPIQFPNAATGSGGGNMNFGNMNFGNMNFGNMNFGNMDFTRLTQSLNQFLDSITKFFGGNLNNQIASPLGSIDGDLNNAIAPVSGQSGCSGGGGNHLPPNMETLTMTGGSSPNDGGHSGHISGGDHGDHDHGENNNTNFTNSKAPVTSSGEVDESKDDRAGDKKVRVLFVTNDGRVTPDMADTLNKVQEHYRQAGVNVDFEAVTDKNGSAFQVSDLKENIDMNNNSLSDINGDFDDPNSQTGQLRKKYQADMVVGVGDGGGGGVAWVDGYAAVQHGPNVRGLAHELGHNFGLLHSHDDPDATDRDTLMSYEQTHDRFSAKEAKIINSNLEKRANGFENWNASNNA